MAQDNSQMSEKMVVKPMTMVDLIAYQENSIVSRQIVDKKSGTVTIFAFDQGQGLSEHTAPYDALVEILDGQARICIDGHWNVVIQGQMILMPAHRPHAVKAESKFKMLLVMIKS